MTSKNDYQSFCTSAVTKTRTELDWRWITTLMRFSIILHSFINFIHCNNIIIASRFEDRWMNELICT